MTIHSMPFGKYRGWDLEKLPDDYLDWLLSLNNLRPILRTWIYDEARRRTKSDPFHPPKAARQLPALADVEELITAGLKTLAKKYHPDINDNNPTDMANFNHAADWLRICVRDVLTSY